MTPVPLPSPRNVCPAKSSVTYDAPITRPSEPGQYKSAVSVSDSTVAFNGGSGITTVQGILDTPSGIYSNDRVFHNGGDGIYTSESPSYFNGNRVTDNAGDGTFNLDDAWSFAPFYHYKNNTADRNGGVGITLSILEGGTPQSVDDQGGNEAKLNAGGQCAVFGLTCSSIAWR